ncbi:MAG: hypothetical protein AYK19_04865 [Theionarchaea archaeon DG-70-1]|nr:MAG: hypothetical protein AYK19_04865 [Theionarchaea archaeon DG-70-1]
MLAQLFLQTAAATQPREVPEHVYHSLSDQFTDIVQVFVQIAVQLLPLFLVVTTTVGSTINNFRIQKMSLLGNECKRLQYYVRSGMSLWVHFELN